MADWDIALDWIRPDLWGPEVEAPVADWHPALDWVGTDLWGSEIEYSSGPYFGGPWSADIGVSWSAEVASNGWVDGITPRDGSMLRTWHRPVMILL